MGLGLEAITGGEIISPSMRLGFESHSGTYLLVGWSWENYLTRLSLGFFIYKMKIICLTGRIVGKIK